MEERKQCKRVSACFKVLFHTKKGNEKWLLSETTEVMWSECNTRLVTFNGLLEKRNCPLEVNVEALEALLPQLEMLLNLSGTKDLVSENVIGFVHLRELNVSGTTIYNHFLIQLSQLCCLLYCLKYQGVLM